MKNLTTSALSVINWLFANNLPIRLPAILILLIIGHSCHGQNEAWYAELINTNHFRGRTEVTVQGGRADIVNADYAIEVEFASKWKNAIGQALWYGLQLERQPGIVLVMKDINDRKYGIMLQSAIDYVGLTDKIKVWFYPEDFGIAFAQPIRTYNVERQQIVQTKGQYSINKSSGVRHNSRCHYYDCKNCEASNGDKGKACGKCGG